MKRFLLLLIIFVAACKKVNLPPVENGDPVFLINAEVDGGALELTAGEHDYYLFTSYERDIEGVMTMTGVLKPESCTDCGPYIKLTFREKVASTAADFNISTALPIGGYTLEAAPAVEEYHYMLQLTAAPSVYEGDNVTSYYWTFDNGLPPLQELNPLIELDNFTQPITVTLANTTALNCNSSVEKTISFNAIAQDCGVDFDFEVAQGGFFNQITAIPDGTPPFTYLWLNGNATASIYANNNPQDSTFSEECVTTSDANGCQIKSCLATKNYPINPTQGEFLQLYCYSNFSYETFIDTVEIVDPLQYGLVTIEYGDALGNIYRSDQGPQDLTSFFELLEIEDYEDNENGEKTIKFDFQASALLYDNAGVALPFSTVLSTFAIAYPE